MKDRVDILLATYQGGLFLRNQLQSILQQSYPYFHLIIRDDGSTDQTLSIIDDYRQAYPDQISLLSSSQRFGVKGNFSELMRHANANYIMFCDQDDIWLPNKIESTLCKMKELENQNGSKIPLLIHTDLQVVKSDLSILDSSFWNYSQINPFLSHLNRLLVQNIVTGCTMMINQKLQQLAYPIPQEAIMHDWWLAIIASAFGKIDFLAKPTILYRQHSKNDVGAMNWKSISTYVTYAKKVSKLIGREELRYRLNKTFHQASHFLKLYQDLLEPQKREIVEKYLSLSTAHPIKKRYLFFKHRFFKNSLAKNIGMLLLL